MNALELNEWIDNSPYSEHEEVVILLRQQAAEIDSLKDRLMLTQQSLDIIDGWTKK